MSEIPPAAARRRRRRLWSVLAALGLLLAIDLARPPGKQLSARLLVGGLDLYQATLSPLLGRAGVRCRFTPSCSRYAEAAVAHRGALAGSWLTLRRLARCGPWTPAGTEDPPPPPRQAEPEPEWTGEAPPSPGLRPVDPPPAAVQEPSPEARPDATPAASGNIGRIDGGEVISVEQSRYFRLGHRGPTLA